MFRFDCERDNDGMLVIKVSDDKGKPIVDLATSDEFAERLARAILFEIQSKEQQFLAIEGRPLR